MKKDNQNLFERMEELRQQMVDSAEILGLCHPTVLYYSQQLDAVYTETMRRQYPSKSTFR